MVNGKQMTLCWHVDDMKISHCVTKRVDDMVSWLREMYEHLYKDGSGAIEVCRGKVHEYIGMTLDFNVPGKVKVTMLPYVKEIVGDFTKQSGETRTATTPAAEHLFQIDETASVTLPSKAETPGQRLPLRQIICFKMMKLRRS
jgi:hypothetical protein